MDRRVIVATLCTDTEPDTPLFTICAIYAPSGDPTARNRFLLNTLRLPFFQKPEQDFILLGDFNYHHHVRQSAPTTWKNWITTNALNIMTPGNAAPMPTFSNHRSRTTIDYIFASPSLTTNIEYPQHNYLNRFWTDHNLLSCQINLEAFETGQGVWRMNTMLLQDKKIRDLIYRTVDEDLEDLAPLPTTSAWEELKAHLQRVLQEEGRAKAKECRALGSLLQRRRDYLLRRISWYKEAPQPNLTAIKEMETELEETERRLDGMLEKVMTSLAIRTQTKWQDLGERCQTKRNIIRLRCPATQTYVTDPTGLCRVSRAFYSKLYTPDPVDEEAIQELIDSLPNLAKVDREAAKGLCEKISDEEIRNALDLCPSAKAPGLDGFPFEILRVLCSHQGFFALFSKVLNNALEKADIPESWQHTMMILLHKKGDAADLGNWRPLSLINSDAKVFTKIITLRLQGVMDNLIGPCQTGFVRNRLIADNGLVMQAIREYCRKHKEEGMGVLFDQEKAYDRVHPRYLRKVMVAMGFPEEFTEAIFTLFFGTNIHLNINGYLAQPFLQQRGLRQGDPLSPLLFNIAIEPLIQSII